jgi:hypothetical protein
MASSERTNDIDRSLRVEALVPPCIEDDAISYAFDGVMNVGVHMQPKDACPFSRCLIGPSCS